MSKTLVTYFSAERGTTAALAEKLEPYLNAGTTISGAKVFNGPVSEADLKAWVESL